MLLVPLELLQGLGCLPDIGTNVTPARNENYLSCFSINRFPDGVSCVLEQGPVVQRLDNAIYRINCYPADKCFPPDRDFCGG